MAKTAADLGKPSAGRVVLTDSQRADRRATVRNAIATQQLEGLVVNPATVADLESYANGELDLDEARQRALARIEAERLRRMREGASETEPESMGKAGSEP